MSTERTPVDAEPGSAQRWVAGVEYEGTGFSGWQTQQAGVRTVQDEIVRALSYVADHPVAVTCAGRTDAGVHAVGQVVHFDVRVQREAHAWLLGANSRLPDDVNLRWVRPVVGEFDARGSANERIYRYVIWNRGPRSALGRHRSCWVYHRLDAVRMHEAAQALVGEHDFSAYRAVACQSRTPQRRVEEISVTRRDDLVWLEVRANAFLHHMVRNIAGVLIEVGKGEADVDWPRQVLETRDRTRGGVTAPAEGLYFMGVRYPDFPRIDALARPAVEPLVPGTPL